MPVFTIMFLIGNMYINSSAVLPTHSGWALIAVMVISAVIFARYQAIIIIAVIGLINGLAWTALYATSVTAARIPASLEGVPLEVEGIVASIPIQGEYGQHFLLRIDKQLNQRGIGVTNSLVRITWNTASSIYVGDKYKLSLRLKRVHALRNVGTYNYEIWALQNQIAATGSVITSDEARFRQHTLQYPINQIRQKVNDVLIKLIPGSPTSHWIIALTIGERYAATRQDWYVLRATGTNHLMAIAGLHIGLISGFIHFLSGFIWRRSFYLCCSIPSQMFAAACALVAAWAYSALAGFSLPTQRACAMISFIIISCLIKRTTPAWQAWSLALIAVLVLNPLSTFSESFWLSFVTIGLIIFGMHARINPRGWWWKWMRVQWVIGIGLIPVTLYFFQETSLTGVIVNSIAIPWLGFIVLPASLTGMLLSLFSHDIASYCLMLADMGLMILWRFLSGAASFDFSMWVHPINTTYIFTVTVIACLMLLAPAGMPGRALAGIWVLPLFIFNYPRPGYDGFWLSLLDVGQGLSAVVQTKKHTLVFDTGAKFGDNSDMGESVVVPFLRSEGVNKVDVLVISHGDNDHAGGLRAVMRAIPVLSIKAGEVYKIGLDLESACVAGESWVWDGVRFQFLSPRLKNLNQGNNSSCVLKINNHRVAVLLTGDIEKYAETQMLKDSVDLRANVLIAPHHGSKTSGLNSFIDAVAPQYVLIPAGYRNRYRLPHQSVTRKYSKRGILWMNTAASGAIKFEIESTTRKLLPIQYRYLNNHYWDVF